MKHVKNTERIKRAGRMEKIERVLFIVISKHEPLPAADS
jgi:hypothetical protein